MLHHVPYAVAVCGLVGIPLRMLLDARSAWPTIMRLREYPRDATVVVHYSIISTPHGESAVYDPKLIEEEQLAA